MDKDELFRGQEILCGRSFWGEGIIARRLGQGRTGVLFAGSLDGDHLAQEVLELFEGELSKMAAENAFWGRLSLSALLEMRFVCFLPRPNPDALRIKSGRISTDDPFYAGVQSMCGKLPMPLWSANGRGVDLSRNFNYRFDEYRTRCPCRVAPFGYCGAYPESEPESAAFARLARSLRPRLFVHLTGGRNTLQYSEGNGALHGICIRYAPYDREEGDLSASAEGWISQELGCAYLRIGAAFEGAQRSYALLRPLLFALCGY